MAKQQHDPQQSGVDGGAVATFGAALLAALGLNRAVRWLRERRAKKQQDQQRQQQAERADEIEKLQEAGHESSDASFGMLATVAAGGVGFIVVMGIAIWLMFNFYAVETPTVGPVTQLNPPVQVPQPPRLQADPQSDWLRLRATQTALLNSYGVDPTSGAIHIPIDRAMEIVATRGLTATNGITTTGGTP